MMSDNVKKERNDRISVLPAVIGFLLLIALDQGTKLLAVYHLKGRSPKVLIPGTLELSYVENRGAAFGIFQNQIWIFIAISLFFLAAAVYVWVKMPKTAFYLPLHITVFFLAAGAAGNVIDRILRGFVVDFIYFSLIDFPVFNVADIYVTCGAAVLIFLILFKYKEENFEFLKR